MMELRMTYLSVAGLMLTVLMFASPSTTEPKVRCPLQLCNCSNETHIAKCAGRRHDLTFIPEFPSFVNKVILDSNKFKLLSKEIMANLTKINLTDLSIQSVQVQIITMDAFSELYYLANINFGSNIHLNVTSLKLSLPSLQAPNFDWLSLENMKWTSQEVSAMLFTGLNGRNIRRLSLNSNNIESLFSGALKGLEGLKHLLLSNNQLRRCDEAFKSLNSLPDLNLRTNQISQCDISNLPRNINNLLINNNRLTAFPNFCAENSASLLPELTNLRIDNNNINNLDQLSFTCLPKLRKLSLTKNELQEIKANTFSGLKRLQSLYLSEMKNTINDIGENAFSIPSLKKFEFKRNNFHFTTAPHTKKASLRNCTNLEILDLSHNYMPKWPDDARIFLQGLTKLRILRLVKVYWHLIPDGLFKLLPSLTNVSLSENSISTLNSSLFSEYSMISEMKLDLNNIAYIGPGSFTQSFWKAVKILDLSGNPFLCDCSLLWFRDKVWSSHRIFKQYQFYRCHSPPERKGLSIYKFNLTADECKQKSELLLVLITTGSVVVFLVLCMLFAYKGRWHIRYWIYLLRYRRSSEYVRINDRNLRFDAFIVYADDDSNFVHKTLLIKLENEHGYKLCVHTRDFEVGKIIADNIVECMSECRQVLVVLSNNFCKSKWCRYELAIAQDRWFNNESEAMVLVLLEDMDSRSMTKDIRALIKTTTYALWTENSLGQELFWEQLVSALKK